MNIEDPIFDKLIYPKRQAAIATAMQHTLMGTGTSKPVAGFKIFRQPTGALAVTILFAPEDAPLNSPVE